MTAAEHLTLMCGATLLLALGVLLCLLSLTAAAIRNYASPDDAERLGAAVVNHEQRLVRWNQEKS